MAQIEFFGNPNVDRLRARYAVPYPDAAGCFGIEDVADIANRHGCNVLQLSDLGVEVFRTEGKHRAMLTATAPGLWHTVAILRAISEAAGRRAYEADMRVVRTTDSHGLDERKITRALGAAGVKCYYTKTGPYPGEVAGTWTKNAIRILHEPVPLDHQWSKYGFRYSVRVLEDVGLLDVRRGPRGGITRAVFSWTPLAFLPPTTRRDTVKDDAAEDHALDCIAHGLA